MEFVEFTDLLPNNATSEYDNVVWKDYIIPLNNLVKQFNDIWQENDNVKAG